MPSVVDLLKSGCWTVPEVAAMLDTAECLVERWCRLKLLRDVRRRGAEWEIPGRALFFFLSGRVEPHYSAATVGALLDVSEDTIRGWIKKRRLAVMKLGGEKSSPVRIAESELKRFLALRRS